MPAQEPTPFVKEREASGAGHVINPRTGTTKKVTRGKNATKGRGVVNEAVVPTAPLPKASVTALKTVAADDYEDDNDEDDESFGGGVQVAADEEEEDDEDPGILVQKEDSAILFNKDDDGITHATTPVYSNDM